MDDIRSRMERGRKAIRLAREKGMDTSSWEKELARLEALAQAEGVARYTSETLDNRGWCLWKCSSLNNDIIVVCRDEIISGYPKGYPVYIEHELESIGRHDISPYLLNLVHEVKKLAGAVVVSIGGSTD